MKRILLYVLGVGAIIGLGYYFLNHGNTISVENKVEVPAVETPKQTPEELMEQATQELVTAAIAASSTEIEAKKEEAATAVEQKLKLEIEKQVRADIAAKNDSRQQEIDKQLSF